MGELGALFNPGMRHEMEERRAKAARREEEGNARDGDLRIDLDSGVAVINAPGDDQDTTEPDTAEQDATGGPPAVGTDHSASEAQDDGPAAADGPVAEAPADTSPAAAPLRPRGKRAMSASRR